MSTHFEEIYEYVKDMPIIDTHNHLPAEEIFRSGIYHDKDFLCVMSYGAYGHFDMVASGMELPIEKMQDVSVPVLERWKLVEPYWENVKFGAYQQALSIAVRDLYGIDRIDSSTIEEISKRFAEESKMGRYREVLQDRCKIEAVVNDNMHYINQLPDKQGPFSFEVAHLYEQVCPLTRADVMRFGEEVGIHILSMQDLDDACEAFVNQALQKGAVAIKYSGAYERSLYFRNVSRSEAEGVFTRLMTGGDCTGLTVTPLQDYLMHHFLQLADKHEMVVQIHVGQLMMPLNPARHVSRQEQSNPLLLENLFRNYTHAKFDLLHIYPFENVAASLAKMYPNVYLDMAWTHILSPLSAQRMLEEWIEVVPKNKIMGFGGDAWLFVDYTYGHQYIARRNIARALASKMESGLLDLEQAKQLAQDILYNNPKRLFGLKTGKEVTIE